MPAITGRKLSDVFTNSSGGALVKGDVVIVNTGADKSITTTATGQAEVTVGVVIEENGIASAATGRVLLAGYAPLVNVPASVTRGHYVETHTVVKQATGSATRRAGSFGQFLTGGTTPTAWLWGVTDQTGTSSSVGILGSDLITSNQVTSGTTELTLHSLAVSVAESRILKVTFHRYHATFSVSDDTFNFRFYLDTVLQVGRFDMRRPTTTQDGIQLTSFFAGGTAASRTVEVRVVRAAGTGTLTLSSSTATQAGFMLVEDIGAA